MSECRSTAAAPSSPANPPAGGAPPGTIGHHEPIIGAGSRPGVATGSRHRPGHASLADCGGGLDAEDGDLRGDSLELLERGFPVDRDMGTSPGGEHQIAAQDGRPEVHGDLLQDHGFAPPAPYHGPPPGRPNVAHPLGPLAKHGDDVALAVPVRDHKRGGDGPTATPTHHLERGGAPRSEPGAEENRRRPILESHE